MAITDWPENERPREKLLSKGPEALSDAEILAIFLRTGTPGKTAVDLARDLLNHFGSLRALLGADYKQFCIAQGVGEAKYVQIQASLEMGRRYLGEQIIRDQAVTCPNDAQDFLTIHLRDHPQEVFAILFLDTRHQIICFEKVFHGTLDEARIYPREVVKKVLQHNAAAVILAHNHPSGKATPSQADILITQRLKKALDLVDVRLIDHIIVGEGENISLAEKGLV